MFSKTAFWSGTVAQAKALLSFSAELADAKGPLTLKEICDNIRNYTILGAVVAIQLWAVHKLYTLELTKSFRSGFGWFVVSAAVITCLLLFVNVHQTFLICEKMYERLVSHFGSSENHYYAVGIFLFAMANIAAAIVAISEFVRHLL